MIPLPSSSALLAADMMDEPASIGLFIALTVGIGVAAASFLPLVFRRLPVRLAIPGLAVIGPVLVVGGSLVGSGAITLSGNDIGYVVLVASITGIAAIMVGWRLSNRFVVAAKVVQNRGRLSTVRKRKLVVGPASSNDMAVRSGSGAGDSSGYCYWDHRLSLEGVVRHGRNFRRLSI